MTDNAPVQLSARIRVLLQEAGRVYAGTSWQVRFAAAEREIGGPLRIALAGRVKAGKSTLLNALIGEEAAATDAGECTRVVSWYAYGPREAATAIPRGRRDPSPLPVRRDDGRLVVDLRQWSPEELVRVEVTLPNAVLAGLIVVDTPGMGSALPQRAQDAARYLTGADEDNAAPDAIIYLMRQLHVADADFLEAFRDPSARGVPPVNAVAVISRADEIGGGSDQAMHIAAEITGRYARDPRLRSQVQAVLPVAGLLAEASGALTDAEFEDVRSLAALPAALTDELVLSAGRFTAPRLYLPVGRAERIRLIERLGLFGVRLVLNLMRRPGSPDAAWLRACLARTSGLQALRDVLASQIIGRRELLKADAALRLVQRAVAEQPSPGGMRVVAMAERLRLGLHDFAELQLLNELRLGLVPVPDDLRKRMETLLGAAGGSAQARLGIARPDTTSGNVANGDADPGTLRRLLMSEHNHWHAMVADPLTAPPLRRAAAVLQRTVEGLLMASGRTGRTVR